MNTPNIKSVSDLGLLIGVGLVVLVFSSAIHAQLSGRAEQGFQAGNSYAISDIESINMNSGNVSMSIPLASLPKGRGTSPGFTISLTYNSKLWDSVQHWEEDGLDEFNNQADYVRNLLYPTEYAGWNVFLEYKLNIVERTQPNPGVTVPREEKCVPFNENYSKNGYAFRVEIRMPGGGVTGFRPYGTGHHFEDYHKDGFFEIAPNGQARHSHLTTIVNDPQLGTYATCSNTYPQISTSGMNYYSTDGSNIRLFVPYNSGSAQNSEDVNWLMYYPNGTIVENLPPDDTTIRQRITDANGNRVKIKSDTHNSVPGTKVIDDVGRFIFYGGNKVIQSGFGGEELETTLSWKTQWVYRNYRTVDLGLTITIPNSKKYVDAYQSFQMLDAITLPSQAGSLTYEFNYHAADTDPYAGSPPYTETDGWGELASVELPSGATANYSYDLPENETGVTHFLEIVSNKITRKDLVYDETYDESTTERTDSWVYDIQTGISSVTGPDGGTTTQKFYDKSPFIADEGTDWRSGLVYEVINPDGSKVVKTWKQEGNGSTTDGQPLNPYVSEEITTITSYNGSNPGTAALESKKEFDYDQNSNLLEVREYDWKTVGGGSYVLKRKTLNSYYNQTLAMTSTSNDSNYYANPSSPTQLGLAKSVEIQNGTNTAFTRTELLYDGASMNPPKGNLTESRSWDSTKTSTLGSPDGNGFKLSTGDYIAVSSTYDTYGNPLTTTDAKGVSSQFVYGPINGYAGLYPTQTKTAFGTAQERTATAEYDFYTGLVTSATDVDNNVTSETEYDALGRPVKAIAASGTAKEVWTQTEYDDDLRRVITRSDLEVKGDGKAVSVRHFDELGRVRLTRSIENIATEDPYDESDGIKVQTRYRYDDGSNPSASDGVYSLTSNPYRAATSSAASNEPTMGWTLSYSDKTGRLSTTKSYSGSTLPAPWGSNSVSTGETTKLIDSNTSLVTDASGRQIRTLSNALGQLIRVDEPNGAGNLGSVSNPEQATEYKYGTAGQMIEVTQGVQKRFFLYDSVGRLIRIRQPEQETNSALSISNAETSNTQWTAGFTHDANGNVLTATDAENNTITAAYDAQNRVLSQTYSDGVTPTVTYTYDDISVSYSKGRLTKVQNSVSSTQTVSFDVLGRPNEIRQITDGNTYPMKYNYNLAGQVIEEEYPSGRKVKVDLDANGDLSRIYGKSSPVASERTYATGFEYTPDGKIEKLKIGNGKWESAKFNSNLQVTELALGASQGNGDLWKLNYEYGELNPNGTVDTTKNTGNIAKQSLLFTGLSAPLVQTYKYDSLYRISEAKEVSGTQQTWIQTFGYDRYGNRTGLTQDILGQQLAINNVTLPGVDQNTNRFGAGQGYVYDKIGNLTKDVTASQSRDIEFDGNNKQTEIKDSATGNKIGEYFYDGNSKRVKKRVFDSGGQAIEDVIFVYSGDRIIAEYSTQPPPQNPTTKYVATDTLGSVRAITNQDGQVISRRDFMPFGEELQPDTTYRRSDLKYNPDDVRQKFTGYQKDEESGLDFAEARMYNNAHGRFTAVDPLLASGKSANPQTFNRYAYTMNRPLILTDPTGLQSGRKPEEADITVETQLSRKAPSIKDVKVTLPNGNTINEDLFVGDRFVISYTYRINKPDAGQDATTASRIENVTGTRTTKFDSKGNSAEYVEEEMENGSFSGDLEGAQTVGNASAEIAGVRNDEVEVRVSQEFEITGDRALTPGGSNSINFQIVVTDPRAPIAEDRNSSAMERGRNPAHPANPAIFTTKRNDKRNEITKDPDKAIGYRNRRRNE